MTSFEMEPLNLKLLSGEEIEITDIEIMDNGDIWLYNKDSKVRWYNSELFDLRNIDLIDYLKD